MEANQQTLEELIDETVSIPTIPSLLVEMNAVLSSADGSTHDAAEIIERDPAIAAKALRLVNSSFYALPNAVSSISLACSILGLKVINNLVLQATVLDAFAHVVEVEDFKVEELWDHSFKTAMAARILAQQCTADVPLHADDAYTAGLIHDVGQMVLLQAQPRRFKIALRASKDAKIHLATAENDTFGFNHAQVGGLLAQRWKLSEGLQQAVTYHHEPGTGADVNLAGLLVCVANDISGRAAPRPHHVDGPMPANALEELGITLGLVHRIRSEVRSVTL